MRFDRPLLEMAPTFLVMRRPRRVSARFGRQRFTSDWVSSSRKSVSQRLKDYKSYGDVELIVILLGTAENGEKQQMDISYPTSAFIRAVKAWDHYDEPSMGITIKPVKQ
jgi:poly(A) polymerase Pap1